jgi:DnaA family protein
MATGDGRNGRPEQTARGQLPLALRLDRHASFESFEAAGNAAAVAHLEAAAAGAGRDPIWLWGEAGAGKTHLLQAACRRAAEAGLRAMYLVRDAQIEPALLSELERVDLVAVDDLERMAGDPVWEESLFALVDARYQGAGALIMAADRSPAALPFRLPDLASRAAGTVVYRLAGLDDQERLTAVVRHAALMGLELDAATAGYLIRRVERDMRALIGWLERIDRAALIAQRRVTVPFIRELIGAEGDG